VLGTAGVSALLAASSSSAAAAASDAASSLAQVQAGAAWQHCASRIRRRCGCCCRGELGCIGGRTGGQHSQMPQPLPLGCQGGYTRACQQAPRAFWLLWRQRVERGSGLGHRQGAALYQHTCSRRGGHQSTRDQAAMSMRADQSAYRHQGTVQPEPSAGGGRHQRGCCPGSDTGCAAPYVLAVYGHTNNLLAAMYCCEQYSASQRALLAFWLLRRQVEGGSGFGHRQGAALSQRNCSRSRGDHSTSDQAAISMRADQGAYMHRGTVQPKPSAGGGRHQKGMLPRQRHWLCCPLLLAARGTTHSSD
jgi:hypothetical protein